MSMSRATGGVFDICSGCLFEGDCHVCMTGEGVVHVCENGKKGDKCIECGKPVGNDVFTVCDDCWEKSKI